MERLENQSCNKCRLLKRDPLELSPAEVRRVDFQSIVSDARESDLARQGSSAPANKDVKARPATIGLFPPSKV
jgi:hypothetical protein